MIQQPSTVKVFEIGRGCNQGCNDCFLSGANYSGLSNAEEIEIILKIKQANPNALVFPYPKDLSTSLDLLDVMRRIQVGWGMTNGAQLDDETLELLLEKGITNLKITLYANEQDQFHLNGNAPETYELIKKNIARAVMKGMRIDLYSVLDRTTAHSVSQLADLADDLGASKIRFFRLLPLGNANKKLDEGLYIRPADMFSLIEQIETSKQKHPDVYLSLGLHFGVNFHGKTHDEAIEKVGGGGGYSQRSMFPCPALNYSNANIALKSNSVFWCLYFLNEKEGYIGKLSRDTGIITLDESRLDLTPETLSRKLEGICSVNDCEYHDVCLGGCRSSAALFAKKSGHPDPLYASMDICLTRVYKEMFG